MTERVIIVGAGLMTVPAIEVARQMGLEVVVFDGDPKAPGMALADRAVTVSTKDPDASAAMALDLAREAPISGVFTAGADVEVTVAAIARALGLPGASVRSAEICNHKGQTRRALAAAGIPGPRFAEISSVAEGLREAPRVGFPLMVKPIDNCGSRGVVRVDGPDWLELAVEEARRLSRQGTVLLEEHVTGTTHTVEMIAHEGELHLGSVIDTHHGYAPHAVELRHVNPSERSAAEQRAMVEIAIRAARAVGISDGPAKVDVLFPPSGPVVMEMTARLSGGWHCQYTTPLALGTNSIRAVAHVAMGKPPLREDIEPRWHRFAVSEALFPKPGRVVSIRGLEEARRIPNVAQIFVLAREGEVIPEYESSADRRVYVIACGETRVERDAAVRRVRDTLVIETERP